MSMDFRAVFGLGLLVLALLAVAARVLMLLFWRRVRHVNPTLWEARNRATSLTTPISKFRPFSVKVLFPGWKHDWEREYGSLDDIVLDRLAGAAKGIVIVTVTIWVGLMGLALAQQFWSKF